MTMSPIGLKRTGEDNLVFVGEFLGEIQGDDFSNAEPRDHWHDFSLFAAQWLFAAQGGYVVSIEYKSNVSMGYCWAIQCASFAEVRDAVAAYDPAKYMQAKHWAAVEPELRIRFDRRRDRFYKLIDERERWLEPQPSSAP